MQGVDDVQDTRGYRDDCEWCGKEGNLNDHGICESCLESWLDQEIDNKRESNNAKD